MAGKWGGKSLIERQSPTDRIVADGIYCLCKIGAQVNATRQNDPGYIAISQKYPEVLVPVYQIAPWVHTH